MSYKLPDSLIGTTRIRPSARAGFGDFLDAVAANGRNALLTEGGVWVWETLRAHPRRRDWDICALVPHVAGYVREATDYGMFGAGWRRLRRIHPLSWGRLCVQGFCNIGRVLRRDFPTLLALLLETEMASFRRAAPPVVFLHPQITDLLLAMDHGAALEQAAHRIRRGFGAEPGLATNNLGALLPRLRTWGLEMPYLLTPVHPRGYGMRPSRQTCEEGLRTFKGRLVATLETDLDTSTARYWQIQGVASALYDVAEPSVAAWELWKIWQRLENTEPGAAEPAGQVLTAGGCLK